MLWYAVFYPVAAEENAVYMVATITRLRIFLEFFYEKLWQVCLGLGYVDSIIRAFHVFHFLRFTIFHKKEYS